MLQAAVTFPVIRQTSNLKPSGIMKNILSLSLCLTLVACSSGLPELKYADGSTRIPINLKPIPLQNTTQPAATAQSTKPGDTSAAAVVEAAKPAAKHGCRRPQEKAIGFEGLEKVQSTDQQSKLTFYH